MSSGPPTPIAEGTLAATPLAHVLVHIVGRSLTGTLAIWPEQKPGAPPVRGQDRILFAKGRPVAARFMTATSAIELGLLPLFSRTDGPYAFYEQDLVGDGPEVVRGSVDPYTLLIASQRGPVREDAVERVLGQLGASSVRLRPDVPLARFDLDPRERAFVEYLRASPGPIAELASTSGDARVARRVLYVLAITHGLETFERAASEAAAPAGAAAPTGAVVATFGKPATGTAPMSTRASAPPPDADDPTPVSLGAPPGPPAPAPTRASSPGALRAPGIGGRPRFAVAPDPPPDPPPTLTPEMRARWIQVADRARKLEDQNYFDMLGVDRSAGPDAIKSAYLDLVKQWHPDRLPEPLRELRPWAERIFHFLTQARDVLTEHEKRGQYLRAVQDGGGTPSADRKVQVIVQAAMEFQKVEVLARRREWDEALKILDAILEAAPDEADYHAMKASMMFQKHGTTDDALVVQMIAECDRALKADPRSERAHMAKGTILKRLGREDAALAHFREVVDINPKNIDAVREVRIAAMRGKSKAPPASSKSPPGASGPPKTPAPGGDGGLLSKLFGSKKKP